VGPRHPREIGDAIAFLRDHLVSHAQAEEAVAYPTIEQLQGVPGATAAMVADHTEIVARLGTLGTLSRSLSGSAPSGTQANELRSQLYGLRAVLELHFGKEENPLLPVLDAHLSEAEALALFQRMAAAAHPGAPPA